MQIVIDIPEKDLECLKRTGQVTYSLVDSILKGTILSKNATNGDVIKALFPDIEIADSPCLDKVYTGIPFGKYIGANIDCMREWWNAPYEVGDTDGNS